MSDRFVTLALLFHSDPKVDIDVEQIVKYFEKFRVLSLTKKSKMAEKMAEGNGDILSCRNKPR